MTEPLNIATMPIADKVQRHMMASYYMMQIEALQTEAARLGYFFAQADAAVEIPALLADRLAWAVEYRRNCYLYPEVPHRWSEWTASKMQDGYSQEHLRTMLAALGALGVYLTEGEHAGKLLAAEEYSSTRPIYGPGNDLIANHTASAFMTLMEGINNQQEMGGLDEHEPKD